MILQALMQGPKSGALRFMSDLTVNVGGAASTPLFFRVIANAGDAEEAVQNLINNRGCNHANAGSSAVVDITSTVDRIYILAFGSSLDTGNGLYAVGGTDQNARDAMIFLDPTGGTATQSIVSMSTSFSDEAVLQVVIVE